MSGQKKLHVISFNIPYPANYGGVICVFYHLKALHHLGADIKLHSFEYGRERAEEVLQQHASTLHYYQRNTNISKQFSLNPYIVTSRNHPDLLTELLKDDAPILFEGTHVCGYLNHSALKNRLKIVRMHNVEWQYYRNLFQIESNPIKKAFFYIEYLRLKRFEEEVVLKYADHILAISPNEAKYFLEKGFKNTHYVPAFHPNEKMDCLEGQGDFVLYHGDLSVWDNEKAALLLIEKVFANLDIPFIIAGLNPSDTLKKAVAQYDHIQLKPNVPQTEMEWLLQNAHVNILWSFHSAGMKLKLLNALFKGRFCLVNSPMVLDTGMEDLCIVEDEPKQIQEQLKVLMAQSFNRIEVAKRANKLMIRHSNIENAKTTLALIKD